MNNRYDVPLQLNNENPITAILSYLSTDMDILEMGPANGRLTRYLSKEMDCRVSIVEIDQESYVKSRQFAVDGICADIEGNSWYEYYVGKKFDAIIFADVVEHLNRPVEAIRKAKALLKEDGKLLFSIPNIAHAGVISQLLNNKFQYTQTGILDYTHVKFYTYNTFHSLLKDCGLFVYSEKAIHQDINTGDWHDFDHLDNETKRLLRGREFSDVFEYVFATVTEEWYEKNADGLSVERLKRFKGTTAVSTIYIDYGDGFSQDNYIQANMHIDVNGYSFSVVFDLSGKENIKQLRFDPCDYECKIALKSVNGDTPRDITALNHYELKDEVYYFLTKDPNFLITNAELLTSDRIEIKGELEKISTGELIAIIQEQKNELIERINAEHKKVEELSLLHENDIVSLRAIRKTLAEKSEESASLNGSINILSEELDNLKELLLIKSEETGFLKAKVEAKNRGTDAYKAELEATNQELENFKAEIASKNQEIDTLKAELEVKNQELENFKAEITSKNHEIDAFKAKLEDKNQEIISLNQLVSEKDAELNSTNEALAARAEEAAALNQSLTEKNEEALNNELELKSVQSQLSSMVLQYEQAVSAYENILNSSFWRVTKPARCAVDLSKRIFRKTGSILVHFTSLIGKTLRYMKHMGIRATGKKVVCRITKGNKLKHKKSIPIRFDVINENQENPKTGKSVSIVIPSKNAGDEYELLLKNLKNQKGFDEIEIVVVDSGSSDNTVEISRKYGAKVIQIKPEEFSHSYSRNLGAKNASKEYLCVMTQDALPTSEFWLFNLYRAMNSNPDIAAVSCAEYSRSDSDLYHRAFAWNHYKYLGALNADTIMSMPDSKSPEIIRQNGQLSDITCFIKRETLVRYKYRGSFAEDLDLGMRLISDGYKLAFLGNETVIHSHNRGAYYYLKRRFVELVTLKKLFPEQHILDYCYNQVIKETVFLFCYIPKLFEKRHDILNFFPFHRFREEFMKQYTVMRKNNFPSIDVANSLSGLDKVDKQTVLFLKNTVNEYKNAVEVVSDDRYSGLMIDAIEGYLNVVFDFMAECYEVVDDEIIDEFEECVYKILTSVVGTFFAYSYLSNEADRNLHINFYNDIGEGV